MTTKPQALPIAPLDAWRRALDVVIASAPTGYLADVIQQLHDATRSYQLHGPIQRVTAGERKLCNQLHYLGVGQLLLSRPVSTATPPPISRKVSARLTVRLNGVEHDVSAVRGVQVGEPILLDPANLPPVVERDAYGFTLHSPSVDTDLPCAASLAHRPTAQPGAASAAGRAAQTERQTSAHSAEPAPSTQDQADPGSLPEPPETARPLPRHLSPPRFSEGGLVRDPLGNSL